MNNQPVSIYEQLAFCLWLNSLGQNRVQKIAVILDAWNEKKNLIADPVEKL